MAEMRSFPGLCAPKYKVPAAVPFAQHYALPEAAVRAVNPLLRQVNDLLFQDKSREDFAVVAQFLSTIAQYTEFAMAVVRRAEQERGAAR